MIPTGPHGSWCPLITPMAGDTVDEPALRKHVDRLVDGVDGLLALGTTGERASLLDEQADRVVNIVLEQVAGRVPVAVGVGADSEYAVAKRIRAASEANYAAICAPYYFPLSGPALVDFYRRIADDSLLPVVLYNIPKNTVNRLEIGDIEPLATHHNICGIKDSSGDLGFIRQLLAVRDEVKSPFTVLQGSAERLAQFSWLLGIDGYVSGLENIDPGLQRRLADAAARRDLAELGELQQRVDLLCDLSDIGFWLASIKTAVSLLGAGDGIPVPPIPASNADERAAIADLLGRLGLLT